MADFSHYDVDKLLAVATPAAATDVVPCAQGGATKKITTAQIKADPTTPSGGSTVTAVGAFGCNGKTAQTVATLGADGSDLATTQALANAIKAALIANGIGAA